MARNTWCVVPDSEHWIVRPKNSEEPAEHYADKEDAISRAKEIAEEHRPSDVLILDEAEFRVVASYD